MRKPLGTVNAIHSAFLILMALGLTVNVCLARSPTDNYRQHIKARRTGELAYLAEGSSLEAIKKSLEQNADTLKRSLHKAGASDLNVFALDDVHGKTILLAHHVDPNTGEPVMLAWPKALRKQLTAHEHAGRRRDGETTLLDMELICHLPCAATQKPTGEIQRIGLVTELRPEKEGEYRTLHQTVWPGVIDQMTRANISNWTTWCTELDGKVYLIAYFEYVGNDKPADDADSATDPTTIRWWKLTDACQQRLPREKEPGGPWSAMIPLLHIK